MLRTMTRKGFARPSIAIVGAGSLGSALAVSLRAAGYPLKEIVSRAGKTSRHRARALARRVGARATVIGEKEISAGVVWLCVPDRDIRRCAESLAGMKGWDSKVALHSSGALESGELRALRR